MVGVKQEKILLDYNNNKKKKHVYPRSTHHTFTTSNVQYDKGNENAFYGLTCNSDLKKQRCLTGLALQVKITVKNTNENL